MVRIPLSIFRMKIRIILAAVALCTVAIGVRYSVHHSRAARQVAVARSVEVAKQMMGPSDINFRLGNVRIFDSFDSDKFYVALKFASSGTGDKLQEVFYFNASSGQPRMEWSYSVLNNLAKLEVNEGAFVDNGNGQVRRKGQGFEMAIALTPVAWQFQAETISRLGREGVEMLTSLKGAPGNEAL